MRVFRLGILLIISGVAITFGAGGVTLVTLAVALLHNVQAATPAAAAKPATAAKR